MAEAWGLAAAAGVAMVAAAAVPAKADKRDANDDPAGFDVDICDDLAKAVGGEADVGVASMSDRLERAKTIGFSNPCLVFEVPVLARKGAGVAGHAPRTGHPVGSTSRTFEAIALQRDVGP